MRCPFCGNKVGYLRKLAGRNFCCDEHEKAHAQKQDELALARLMEDSFAEPKAEQDPAEPARFEEPVPDFDTADGLLEAEPQPAPEPEPVPEPSAFAIEWPNPAALAGEPCYADEVAFESPVQAFPAKPLAVSPCVVERDPHPAPAPRAAVHSALLQDECTPVPPAAIEPELDEALVRAVMPPQYMASEADPPTAGPLVLRPGVRNGEPAASPARVVPAFTIPLMGPEATASNLLTGLTTADLVRITLAARHAGDFPTNGIAPNWPAAMRPFLAPDRRRSLESRVMARAPLVSEPALAVDSTGCVVESGAAVCTFPLGAPAFQQVSGVRLRSYDVPVAVTNGRLTSAARTVVMPGSGRRLALPGAPRISPAAVEHPAQRAKARNGGSQSDPSRAENGHSSRAGRKPVLAGSNQLPTPDLAVSSPARIPVEACGGDTRPLVHLGHWVGIASEALALVNTRSMVPAAEFRTAPDLGSGGYPVQPQPSAPINAPGRPRDFARGTLAKTSGRAAFDTASECVAGPRAASPVAAVRPVRATPATVAAARAEVRSAAWFSPSVPVVARLSETAALAHANFASLPFGASDRAFRRQARSWIRFPMPTARKPGLCHHLATVVGLVTAGPLHSRPGPPAGSAAAAFADVSPLDPTPETVPAGGLGASAPQLTLASAFPPAGKSADIPLRAASAPLRPWTVIVRPQPAAQLDRNLREEPEPAAASEPASVHDEEIRILKPVAARRGALEIVVLRWQLIPSPVRKAAMALPAIAALLMLIPNFSTRPGEGLLASAEGALKKRASIELEDDFRTGLSRWQGGKEWARGWQYDPAGFLRPGRHLALLTQSLPLSTYRVEFLAQIEQKAITWVVRAKDPDNYYCYKILITKPGPLPTAAIVRYAMVNGRPSSRTQLPLPLNIRNDTMYQVRMDVRGGEFTTYVNQLLVDTWTDAALATGGVGFFCERGEMARLRWVRLTDRDDIVGKVCSYLSGTK